MKSKRRKFSAQFKAKVAVEALKERESLSELSRRFEIHPNMISKWKNEFLEGSSTVFEREKSTEEEVIPDPEKLYAKIGKLELENDRTGDPVSKKKAGGRPLKETRSLKERRILIDPSEEISVRSQCNLLGIHRSGIYYAPAGEKSDCRRRRKPNSNAIDGRAPTGLPYSWYLTNAGLSKR